MFRVACISVTIGAKGSQTYVKRGIFCKNCLILFVIIPLNLTVEFNITTRHTKTTSHFPMDFVKREQVLEGTSATMPLCPHTSHSAYSAVEHRFPRRGEGNLTSEIP
jgi:hypothetical protein